MTIPPIDPACVWSHGSYTMDSGQFAQALTHLYRAEISRANLWRSRLDTTTNWAVVTVGAALTFAFSSPENPHFVLLLVGLLLLVFLWIEARRHSYYALWYHRVRLLETGFLSAMLTPPYRPPPGWSAALSTSLQDPTFVLPRWRSAANRYRRNYIWLFSLLYLSWMLKLSMHPSPVGTFEAIVDRAAVGQWIAGPWVVGFVLAVYITLLGLTIANRLLPSDGEAPPRSYEIPQTEATRRREEQMAIIITGQREAVGNRLMQELHRGVTAVNGIGMYTGKARSVLFCALTSRQERTLQTLVEETDPSAFVILTRARDIRGRGFAPAEPPS